MQPWVSRKTYGFLPIIIEISYQRYLVHTFWTNNNMLLPRKSRTWPHWLSTKSDSDVICGTKHKQPQSYHIVPILDKRWLEIDRGWWFALSFLNGLPEYWWNNPPKIYQIFFNGQLQPSHQWALCESHAKHRWPAEPVKKKQFMRILTHHG